MKSLHASTIKISDNIVEQLCTSGKEKIEFDNEVLSRVTSLLWDAVTGDWAPDLSAFAKHAHRNTVNVDDMRLLMRRNKRLSETVERASGTLGEGARKAGKASGRKSIAKQKKGEKEAEKRREEEIEVVDLSPQPSTSTTPLPDRRRNYRPIAATVTPLPPQAQSTPLRPTPSGGRRLPAGRLPSPIMEMNEFDEDDDIHHGDGGVGVMGDNIVNNTSSFYRTREERWMAEEDEKEEQRLLLEDSARKKREEEERQLEWERERGMQSVVEEEVAPIMEPQGEESRDMFEEVSAIGGPPTKKSRDSFYEDEEEEVTMKHVSKGMTPKIGEKTMVNVSKGMATQIGEKTMLNVLGLDETLSPVKPENAPKQDNKKDDSFEIEEIDFVPAKTAIKSVFKKADDSFDDDLELIDDAPVPKKTSLKNTSINPFKKGLAPATVPASSIPDTVVLLDDTPPPITEEKRVCGGRGDAEKVVDTVDLDDSFENDFVDTSMRSRRSAGSGGGGRNSRGERRAQTPKDSFMDENDEDLLRSFEKSPPKAAKPATPRQSMFAAKPATSSFSRRVESSTVPNATVPKPTVAPSTVTRSTSLTNSTATPRSRSLGVFSAFNFEDDTVPMMTKKEESVKRRTPQPQSLPKGKQYNPDDSFDFDC